MGDSEIKTTKDLIKEFKKLKDSVEFISQKFDENFKQNAELKKLLNTFKSENDKLRKRVVELEGKCGEIEQISLNKGLILSGIPNQGKNEDVHDITKKVLKAINCKINNNDIEEVYRRGKDGSQIVINLKTEQIRDNILKKRKEATSVKVTECNLNGENNVIYFNEYLTSYMNKLFYDARCLKNNGYKFVWVKSGKIFIRKDEKSKIIQIRNSDDIDNIKN